MPKPELRTAALPTLTVLVRFGFGGSDLVDFKLLARVPAGFSINVNVKRRAPFAPWQPHQACGRERERERELGPPRMRTFASSFNYGAPAQLDPPAS